MASQDFTATADPTAIETALSLSPGVRYFVQNVDERSRVRYRVSTTKPAASDRSHYLRPGESLRITPDDDGGDLVWFWGESVAMIVTDGGIPLVA